MATKKKSSGKKPSSGSDPKSKRIVKGKVGETMHEYKHHQLKSGRSGKKVSNPKQAIAIGLSEARRSGADIPPDPNQRKRATKKKAAAKKAPARKTAVKKKTAAKTSRTKAASKRAPAKKAAGSSAKKTAGRKR